MPTDDFSWWLENVLVALLTQQAGKGLGFLSFCHWNPETGCIGTQPPPRAPTKRWRFEGCPHQAHICIPYRPDVNAGQWFPGSGLPVIPTTLSYSQGMINKFGPIVVMSIHKKVAYAGNWPWFYSLGYNWNSFYQFIGINLDIFNWSLYQHIPSFFMNILGFRKKCNDKNLRLHHHGHHDLSRWWYWAHLRGHGETVVGWLLVSHLLGCAIPKRKRFSGANC